MLTMDQIHHIRQLYYEQDKNISEIVQETGRDRKTVQKYLDMTDFNLPQPEPASERQFCPKLEPYKAIIDQWLTEDRKAPRKQRHTAKRVFHRLKNEVAGFDCSYRLVAAYVANRKEELNLKRKEGYIPLIHHAGEAQADFGSADFHESSKHHSGKYFVMSFPYSNGSYLQLHYGENMECLLESMEAIFEHIGGVPPEIWFDNTKTIVTNIIKGGGREITERFARFQEHYGFKSIFMNQASGWEKGSVENKVGYDRRNMLVPVPRFLTLSDFNKQLLAECEKDSDREHYLYSDQTIRERFDEDQKVLLALPEIPFETAGYQTARTNKWGKFTINNGLYEYSVSPGYPETIVRLKLTSAKVIVMDHNNQVIVTHNRLYGGEGQKLQSMEWLPYLRYIALKPRSLRNSGIYEMMPEQLKLYLDTCPNTERGKILRVLSELTDRTGFDSALQTVHQAVVYEATNADSLKNLYRRLYSDIPELPPLQPQDGIPGISQLPVNLSDYDRLLEGGTANG